MSFIKLPKPVWKLTDDELVERARIVRDRCKPWQKVMLAVWSLLIIGAFMITTMMVDVALDHPARPDVASMILAYLLGGLAGWTMGFALLKAVFLNAEMWSMMRIYRIMLSSWDRVKELERELATKNPGRDLKSPPAGSPSP